MKITIVVDPSFLTSSTSKLLISSSQQTSDKQQLQINSCNFRYISWDRDSRWYERTRLK